jgi:WD40 repeat protein
VFRENHSKLVARKKWPNIYRVAYSPDGTLLAIALFADVILFDVSTETETAVLRGHTTAVTGLCFSPDGLVLVTGSAGELKAWSVSELKEVSSRTVSTPGGVAAIRFCQKNEFFVVGVNEGEGEPSSLVFCRADTGHDVLRAGCHRGAITCLEVSADENLLVTGGRDCTIQLWSMRDFGLMTGK